jgi:hypothetical protein
MFGDYSWLHQRTAVQEDNFDSFLQLNRGGQMVVIELGAGSTIPTIRHLSERLGQRHQAKVLRINPREPQIDAPHFSFAGNAIEVLSQIQDALD